MIKGQKKKKPKVVRKKDVLGLRERKRPIVRKIAIGATAVGVTLAPLVLGSCTKPGI